MSRAKHRAAKLLSGESPAKKFLISMFGLKHKNPVLWFTFWCSQAFLSRAVPANAARFSGLPRFSAGISEGNPRPPGASQPTLSPQQRLTLANALLEKGKQPIFSTKLRRLNPSQELFVELLLCQFEEALKSGNAQFFREMADALETINQGRFADQPRLLVWLYSFNLVDGKPVQRRGITTRGVTAFLKRQGFTLDARTIRRMTVDLGIIKDTTSGRPKGSKGRVKPGTRTR